MKEKLLNDNGCTQKNEWKVMYNFTWTEVLNKKTRLDCLVGFTIWTFLVSVSK